MDQIIKQTQHTTYIHVGSAIQGLKLGYRCIKLSVHIEYVQYHFKCIQAVDEPDFFQYTCLRSQKAYILIAIVKISQINHGFL